LNVTSVAVLVWARARAAAKVAGSLSNTKLANLLVDELRNELFNQGKVVVDFFARIRAVFLNLCISLSVPVRCIKMLCIIAVKIRYIIAVY
jgi:hypothetical protein